MTLSEKIRNLTGMQVRPIGKVRNNIKAEASPPEGSPLASSGEGWRHPLSWGDVVSELVVHKRLAEGLHGLEDYSHILVFFWSDSEWERLSWQKRFSIKFHPAGREDFPLVGVFATRCPRRPNPICATAVRLLERKGNVLKVQGLDTFHGTPIIDIKPYIPYYDSIPEARMADWVTRAARLFLDRPQ